MTQKHDHRPNPVTEGLLVSGKVSPEGEYSAATTKQRNLESWKAKLCYRKPKRKRYEFLKSSIPSVSKPVGEHQLREEEKKTRGREGGVGGKVYN
uniref:Uncharacterized protein n=1 Tax=Nelumbo nucifera TaxID=4432 RepID=A0A822ZII9_NELNU|nr:TPA_asm: hypothetical protein HUJ06_002600 [Nelumbo nucifera]